MAAFEEFVHVEHSSALSFEQSARKLCGVNPVRTRAIRITPLRPHSRSADAPPASHACEGAAEARRASIARFSGRFGSQLRLGHELIELGAVPSEPQPRPLCASAACGSGKIDGPTWNTALESNACCAGLHILVKNSAEIRW
jgi:hypothetical protein